MARAADRFARAALRRSDAVHAQRPPAVALAGREVGAVPLESFPAYFDLSAFVAEPPQPLPQTPTALFVGTLERSKGIATLVAAWPRVVEAVPEARLVVVGRGTQLDLVKRLREELGEGVEHVERIAPAEVARRMDASTCLVLPSLSEGLGRVVVESFARGRGVVASRVGGITDLVEDGRTGLLVESGNAEALAAALVRLLGDRVLAQELGAAAHADSQRLELSADEYATRLRSLVERTLGGTRRS
jgi:glycosyltransferase involved in cell wall biosynthesis